MTQKIIYFVKFARFSNTNAQVEAQLNRIFPDAEIRILDTKSFFTRPSLPLAFGLARLLPRLAWQLITRQLLIQNLSIMALQLLLRDPAVFRAIGQHAREQIEDAGQDVWFSIQTQGLWDNTLTLLPNFIYTDSAALTNLYYKEADRRLLPNRKWISLERALYRKSTRIFVMSDHVLTSLIEHYGMTPDRVRKVLVGANVAPIDESAAPLPADNKTILFVGVEWERKGGPQLIEAFKRLPARHDDARLIIVGTTPAIQDPRIEIVGRVSPAEVSDHYRRAAIFCLPTKIEPFGIVFIEAMLHKLAVVAPWQGAMLDFIRDKETGVLVGPGDGEDLVTALTWLLDHPEERRAIAERGYAEIRDVYTWDADGDRLRTEILAALQPDETTIVPANDASPADLARLA